jgi:tRNA(fMet)-specific endonuclease VapC
LADVLKSRFLFSEKWRKIRDTTAKRETVPITSNGNTLAMSVNRRMASSLSLGTPIDDIDLLIAGVAVANNLVVTHNQRHLSRIESLEVQDWSQE